MRTFALGALTLGLVAGPAMASAQACETPAPEPTPTATTVPTTGDMTNGSGGEKADKTFQEFTSNGVTSKYHIYASDLDWSKNVGVMVYTDGSGEFGLKNPQYNYLMNGNDGLIEVAKRNNMILLTPLAPGGNCDDGHGSCWYDESGRMSADTKVDWSADLVDHIYGQYNIDKSRVALGGYSSGAQWSTRFFGPEHASKFMTDGVVVPISYGGDPAYGVPKNFTQEFKDNVVFSWDTGDRDYAYTTRYSFGVNGGHDWYESAGFDTELEVVWGENHSRDGQFGSIMEREIKEHVKPA